jgi:hypothetical protein
MVKATKYDEAMQLLRIDERAFFFSLLFLLANGTDGLPSLTLLHDSTFYVRLASSVASTKPSSLANRPYILPTSLAQNSSSSFDLCRQLALRLPAGPTSSSLLPNLFVAVVFLPPSFFSPPSPLRGHSDTLPPALRLRLPALLCFPLASLCCPLASPVAYDESI